MVFTVWTEKFFTVRFDCKTTELTLEDIVVSVVFEKG
jgi:hypothetical protein